MIFDHDAADAARGKNPQLTVFDTGQVLEPQIDHGQPGWVDFDNDESATVFRASAFPSVTEHDTTLVQIEALGGDRFELVLNDRKVFVGGAEDEPLTPESDATVGSLDGTIDEADWISVGHVLDAHEVAYIRSLRVTA